jgi:hypothetical protein
VPIEKLRVVRNGIDRPTRPVLGPDERRDLRARLKLPPDARIVLSAGRLRFEREFQPARMARETAAVYEELLGAQRPYSSERDH